MQSSNFVDYVKIFCRSGKGGAGSKHLARYKYVPKGGPDGGNGGNGGNVIVKGNAQLWTLLHLKYTKHIFAENGQNGSSNLKSGSSGNDIIIEVPVGTVIKNPDTEKIEKEITQDGETYVLLKGGKGGLGNNYFKSATNQTPRYAQPGEAGQEAWKIFELKILADVGLVGSPNAGKSTLLSVLSAAKPKIADYPFTTLTPDIGIVAYNDNKSFIMADIPGIIEGAHEGKGLGLRFLRHIERNSVLLFIIPADSNNINSEYEILLNELYQYDPQLLHKNRLLAISKSDLIDDELEQNIIKNLPDIPYVFISSWKNYGLEKLKTMIWNAIE